MSPHPPAPPTGPVRRDAGWTELSGRYLGRLSLRARVSLLAALAVIITVAVSGVFTYQLVRTQLRETTDQSLALQAQQFSNSTFAQDSTFFRQAVGAYQALGVNMAYAVRGELPITIAEMSPAVPLDDPGVQSDVRLAQAGVNGVLLRDAYSEGVHVRVATVSGTPGVALVLIQPLTSVDASLARLGWLMVGIGLVALVFAVTGGWAIARAGLAPVRRLSEAAGTIARTQELSTRPIEAEGDDEIAQLAASFNAMVSALEQSRRRQRQLVADASHELRTPLTSLRTNISLLLQSRRAPDRELDPADLDALLCDVDAQLAELSQLINDLVALARDEEQPREMAPVDFDAVVAAAVERVRRRDPSRVFKVDLRPWRLTGSAAELERAVVNLLDNAVKFSPSAPADPSGEANAVEVELRAGRLTVSDRGPGIPEHDLPHIFDRFYRSAEARSHAGSGLGLAIVRQAALNHGGDVRAENRPGGGTRMWMYVPGRPG
ncbi:sensor histidine kinase [Allonocardiopsis opalescens]|uniref:histidine kinase n=1 Tax=Allonocardiopsis opalescens TaxID=1144618 RepID=A0A2T0Q0A5_9ACTN|nr:ATP-binding protein [Allonocardiopsis opalescens]PRX97232.1 two-component system sensor histidine kinase MprB [Allonocardiopsis opalescens]